MGIAKCFSVFYIIDKMKWVNILLIVFLSLLVTLLVLMASTSYWLSANIYDADKFVETTVGVIQKEEVRTAIANEMVDQVLEGNPFFHVYFSEPVVSAISGFIGSSEVTPIFEKMAYRVHTLLTSPEPQGVSIDLSGLKANVELLSTVLSAVTEAGIPELEIPDEIVIIEKGSVPSVYRPTIGFVSFGPFALLLAIIITVLMVIAVEAKERARVIEILGITIALGGIVFSGLIPSFQPMVITQFASPNTRFIAQEVYNIFSQDLIIRTSYVILVGVVIFIIGLVYGNIELKKNGTYKLRRKK